MLTFSVVIPTYNRPSQLRKCLEALADQDYPRESFEVIVVDDGGTEPLKDMDDVFRDRLPVVFLKERHAGPASARNTGARHAKGRYIAFTDDDCIPARDWLRRFAENFDEGGAQLCGGKVLNGLPDNVYSAASQTILEVVYLWQQKADVLPDVLRFFTTNNLSLPTRKFLECGGLDPLFNVSEDREFCDRWVHSGERLQYVPDAIVYHKHDLNLWTLVRQHFNYGRGAFRFYGLRAQRGWGHLRVDPRFYLLMLRHSIRRPLRRYLPVFGPVLVTQGANAAGYFWEKLIRSVSRIAPTRDSRET